MNFLSPLFLLGALAVVAPIVFHLIRRTTREVKPFSSLMFLQPTPPRVTSRSRIENLWLLLLRCLVLLALALGFARPFFRESSAKFADAGGAARRLAILVDTSASMRREDLWARAREKAEALLHATTPLDAVTVLAFDRTPRVLTDMEQWRSTPVDQRVPAAVRRLAAQSPTSGGTNLGAAILQALDLISGAKQSATARGEIVVISDLQEGARLDGLQGVEWPADVTVKFEAVQAQDSGNASAQWLVGGEEKDAQSADGAMRVRVSNAAESKGEKFRLAWGAVADTALDVYVPAGQSRVVRVPKLPDGTSKIVLTGDRVDFDNSLFLLPITARRAGESVATFELQQTQLVVLGEGATDAHIAAARRFAEEGRLVLVAMTSADSAATVAKLAGVSDFSAQEASVKDFALLAQIDFQSALFAPFADPRFSDFTKIHFWHHRTIEAARLPGAQVLASFDDRGPAVLRMPLGKTGKGGVIVLTSSWRPQDSQLALSSKFVPLMHAIVDESAALPEARAPYFVGDEIALPPLPAGAQAFTMHKPDGVEVPVIAGGKFSGTDQPGIYTANPGGLSFVVNLDPEESRITPLARDRLAALALPMEPSAVALSAKANAAIHAAAGEVEQRQKVWRRLVMAAVIFLLVETFVAARLSALRRSPAATP